MGIQTSPHGIGRILNEINNQYQKEYNTTEKIFDLSGDTVTVVADVEGGVTLEALSGIGEPALTNAGYKNTTVGYTANNIVGYQQGVMSTIETLPLEYRTGMSVDYKDGTLWTIDYRTVEHYDRDGNLIESFGAPNSSFGVCVDPTDGTLWVSGNFGDIYNIDRDGNVLSSFTAGGTPAGITVDPADGTLWYCDISPENIYHIERDGTVINSWGPKGTAPQGIEVDPRDGTLWHVDEGNATIYHLERDLTTINSWAAKSSVPHGIAVDPADGTLWHADEGGGNGGAIYHLSTYERVALAEIDGDTYALNRSTGL